MNKIYREQLDKIRCSDSFRAEMEEKLSSPPEEQAGDFVDQVEAAPKRSIKRFAAIAAAAVLVLGAGGLLWHGITRAPDIPGDETKEQTQIHPSTMDFDGFEFTLSGDDQSKKTLSTEEAAWLEDYLSQITLVETNGSFDFDDQEMSFYRLEGDLEHSIRISGAFSQNELYIWYMEVSSTNEEIISDYDQLYLIPSESCQVIRDRLFGSTETAVASAPFKFTDMSSFEYHDPETGEILRHWPRSEYICQRLQEFFDSLSWPDAVPSEFSETPPESFVFDDLDGKGSGADSFVFSPEGTLWYLDRSGAETAVTMFDFTPDDYQRFLELYRDLFSYSSMIKNAIFYVNCPAAMLYGEFGSQHGDAVQIKVSDTSALEQILAAKEWVEVDFEAQYVGREYRLGTMAFMENGVIRFDSGEIIQPADGDSSDYLDWLKAALYADPLAAGMAALLLPEESYETMSATITDLALELSYNDESGLMKTFTDKGTGSLWLNKKTADEYLSITGENGFSAVLSGQDGEFIYRRSAGDLPLDGPDELLTSQFFNGQPIEQIYGMRYYVSDRLQRISKQWISGQSEVYAYCTTADGRSFSTISGDARTLVSDSDKIAEEGVTTVRCLFTDVDEQSHVLSLKVDTKGNVISYCEQLKETGQVLCKLDLSDVKYDDQADDPPSY